jgi:hypothetical protein
MPTTKTSLVTKGGTGSGQTADGGPQPPTEKKLNEKRRALARAAAAVKRAKASAKRALRAAQAKPESEARVNRANAKVEAHNAKLEAHNAALCECRDAHADHTEYLKGRQPMSKVTKGSPTTSDVHVPSTARGKRPRAITALRKGGPGP